MLLPLLLASIPAFAQGTVSKLSRELATADLTGNVDVIILYNKVPTDKDHANVQAQGGFLTHRMTNVPAGGYKVPGYSLTGLQQLPNVAHISVDHKIKAHMDLSSAATNAATARQQYAVNGSGIGVVVIDSGIGPNSDLSANLVHSEDLTGGDGWDHFGHGTHVAGIIAGSGAASSCSTCTRNLQGIAPGAHLISLRVLDAYGETTDSMLIAAIDRAMTLKSQYNIRVMNLSLGRPVFESYAVDPVCQAVEQAWNDGIVVVVAAGNDGRLNYSGNYGYATINAPANDPSVITVGAMKTMDTPTRTDDNIATYSSKGPTLFDGVVKPDIVAPGNMVVSTMPSSAATLPLLSVTRIPTSYYNSKGSSTLSTSYYLLSGTSMAAAVVSGAVADLLQAQPGLTPNQVKIRLMTSSYKVFPSYSYVYDPIVEAGFLSYYDPFTRGAGYLDVQAALSTTTLPIGNSLSPLAQKQFASETYGMSFNFGSTWFDLWHLDASARNTWGSAEVGANAVIALQTNVASDLTSALDTKPASLLPGATSSVWGNSSVWGSSSVWGNSSVWGSSAVWDTSSIWGKSSVWATSVPTTSSTLLTGEN